MQQPSQKNPGEGRRKWQPTPVFLPGKSHRQRSLTGYSPWDQRVKHDLATKHQQQIWLSPVLWSIMPFKHFYVFYVSCLNKLKTPLPALTHAVFLHGLTRCGGSEFGLYVARRVKIWLLFRASKITFLVYFRLKGVTFSQNHLALRWPLSSRVSPKARSSKLWNPLSKFEWVLEFTCSLRGTLAWRA